MTEEAQQYVRAWRVTATALDRQHRLELQALSEIEAARRFARLLDIGPHPLRPSSGLVEQQRLFARLRHSGQ